MTMSDFEILRDYRNAKNKILQVEILADMNLCTKKEMTAYLEERGETVLKNSTRDERWESIEVLYGQGIHDEEIAEILGLKPASVGQIRIKLGLRKYKKKKAADRSQAANLKHN